MRRELVVALAATISSAGCASTGHARAGECGGCPTFPERYAAIDALLPLAAPGIDPLKEEEIAWRALGRIIPADEDRLLWWMLEIDVSGRVHAVLRRSRGVVRPSAPPTTRDTGWVEPPSRLSDLARRFESLQLHIVPETSMILDADCYELAIGAEGGTVRLWTTQPAEELTSWIDDLVSAIDR